MTHDQKLASAKAWLGNRWLLAVPAKRLTRPSARLQGLDNDAAIEKSLLDALITGGGYVKLTYVPQDWVR